MLTYLVSQPDVFKDECFMHGFPILQSAELPVVDVDSLDQQEEVAVNTPLPTTAMQNVEMSLNKFLSRPRLLNTFQITTSTALDTTFRLYPLQRLFTEAAVIDKIKNYSLMRATICMRVKANTAKTNYQTWLFSYRPNPGLVAGELGELFGAATNGIATSLSDVSNRYLATPYSQRPGFMLQLGTDNDVTFRMPYSYNAEWWPICQKNPAEYWECCFRAITSLFSANEQVPSGYFQFFFWLEDVELSGSSVGPVLQSRDEYGDGVVSRPSSIVAALSRRLEDIPVIGPFARATTIGASAVSAVAKLFGFTNVPVIEPSDPVTSSPMPPIATDSVGFPFERLACDPKTETSISGADSGFCAQDELCIRSFLDHKSIISTCEWKLGDGPGTDIFCARSNPAMCKTDYTGNPIVYHTPMSLLTNFYTFWRGDIELHIHINASPLHNGSVAVYYDPMATTTNLSTVADPFGDVATRVIDLASGERDVVVTIPYTSWKMWQGCKPWATGLTKRYVMERPNGVDWAFLLSGVDNNTDTGLIVIRSLSTLTTMSDSNASVDFIISVKAGKNFEFSTPQELENNDWSYFQTLTPIVQSLDVIGGETAQPDDEEIHARYTGEVDRSLRSLMRRVNLCTTFGFNGAFDRDVWMYAIPIPAIPYAPGYGAFGPVSARYNGAVNAGTYYDWHPTPMVLIMACYTGMRGSFNWSIRVYSTQDLCAHVRRGGSALHNVAKVPWYTYSSTSGVSNAAYLTHTKDVAYRYRRGTTGGAAVTSVNDRATLNFSLPYKSNVRFGISNPIYVDHFPMSERSADVYLLNGTSNSGGVNSRISADVFCGAGTDFALFGFMNVPRMYHYTYKPVVESCQLNFVS